MEYTGGRRDGPSRRGGRNEDLNLHKLAYVYTDVQCTDFLVID